MKQALFSGTGLSAILYGVVDVWTKVQEAIKDGAIDSIEAGSIVTVIVGIFGVIRLRRAIGGTK